MADKSKIEWTDATLNVVTGCTKVSEGCRHCYAERTLPRTGQPFDKVVLHPDRLKLPLGWKKPRRIFVNSLSDLFHEDIPDEFIDQVFATMADTSRHTYQILTKRPDRMLRYLSPDNPRYSARKVFDLTKGTAGKFDCDIYWPLDNVHLGVSIEDQKTADERIPLLLDTPASVRFISAEPLLGAVNIKPYLQVKFPERGVLNGNAYVNSHNTNRLDWCIVGGESGPGARPCLVKHIYSIKEQCQAAGVPLFIKQLGAQPWIDKNGPETKRIYRRDQLEEAAEALGAYLDKYYPVQLKNKKGGDWEEWPEDLRVREFPRNTL